MKKTMLMLMVVVMVLSMAGSSYGYYYRNEMTDWATGWTAGNLTGAMVFETLQYPAGDGALENFGWLGTQANGTTPVPMSTHQELIQIAIKTSQPLHHANWSRPLELGQAVDDATGSIQLCTWGDSTNGDYMQFVVWDEAGGLESFAYNTTSGLDMTQWNVFGILPQGNSVSFYHQAGQTALDPLNLPAPLWTTTTAWNTDGLNMYSQLGNEAQYIEGGAGQVFLTDFIQVGVVPEPATMALLGLGGLLLRRRKRS